MVKTQTTLSKQRRLGNGTRVAAAWRRGGAAAEGRFYAGATAITGAGSGRASGYAHSSRESFARIQNMRALSMHIVLNSI